MLDAYTFEGYIAFMTFTGPEEIPIAFNLILAEDADRSKVNLAARALGLFLMDVYVPDTMEDDETRMEDN